MEINACCMCGQPCNGENHDGVMSCFDALAHLTKIVVNRWMDRQSTTLSRKYDAIYNPIEDALTELVRLKDQADRGLKAGHDYQTNKPLAWERARALVDLPRPNQAQELSQDAKEGG